MLLLLTLGASFTGYLLPWDQLSYWAITVGTNIAGYAPVAGPPMREVLLGGVEVGQNTLIRFYTLHIAALPLLLTLLVAVHLACSRTRLRRDRVRWVAWWWLSAARLVEIRGIRL
jgi:quinol-cytochrome oxidoreductase complex cytochrome b subunit